jgi:hypothetical protein
MHIMIDVLLHFAVQSIERVEVDPFATLYETLMR